MSDISNTRVNPDQALFQQISISNNQTSNRLLFQRIEQSGAKAIVLTVGSAGDRTRQRALRYVPDTNIARSTHFTYMPWPYYRELQNMTSLPIILKGIQTVEAAHMATKVGASAIFLSLHGGRGLDGSQSPVKVALEKIKKEPAIFMQIEMYADGDV